MSPEPKQIFKQWAIALSAIVLLVVNLTNAHAQSRSGPISVLDGNTVQMLGSTVHLYGLEVCDLDQVAHLNGIAWRCGIVSAGWLTQLTLGYQVKCFEEGTAGYAAIYARCFLPDGKDIAKLAIEQGMAMATRQNGQPIEPAYGMIEQEARNNRTGIWSSSFINGGVLYRPGNAF